ncbi:uncharacterized protein EI90DRAFT_923777 [Cantharellus anzutake]|uniref:uncharacterized protein n=1 Tax=Cantharellus anzutake TaxID=1750568 RepID=UPI0019074C3A|nr:uncharacterized protein EI90DRAFT_923777 [Cantharellus anzutake]KAF8332089.1 hypothetical protein EI90DRAFT_923777 [Cantharellus anzutake]
MGLGRVLSESLSSLCLVVTLLYSSENVVGLRIFLYYRHDYKWARLVVRYTIPQSRFPISPTSSLPLLHFNYSPAVWPYILSKDGLTTLLLDPEITLVTKPSSFYEICWRTGSFPGTNHTHRRQILELNR